MRNWLNNRFGINLNEEDLTNVKDFTLIWNVFESSIFRSSFSIAKTEQKLKQQQFDINDFQQFLDYFKNRYVTNSTINGRFQNLNFRRNDRETLVTEVLLGNNENANDVLLAMIIMVYRFRNNLFHGEKDIQVIDQQKTNFKNANELLQLLLEKM
jgi:hypothetical protein